MSLLAKLFNHSPAPPAAAPGLSPAITPASISANHAAEVEHWNAIARRLNAGERLFWLSHPRVAELRMRKEKIDGLAWRDWVVRQWGAPARVALELGCGQGLTIEALVKNGIADSGEGVDLDDSRFKAASSPALHLRAADVNRIELQPERYDLIYSLGSFHHFEALEHIMEQVHSALTPEGFFVLDEYVGPSRFQWTDLQLSITAELLALVPKPLRWYANGIEKQAEGRSTPEQVIEVCPSEAIRSDEIVPLFHQYFDIVEHRSLGGTIQHLLYSGIIQNFPDHVPEIDRMIDSIDAIETRMIDAGILPSDFVLLVGKKRK